MNEQPTLFPVPPKRRKPPVVENGQPFRWEPYCWVYQAVCGKASHFPIARWSRALKQTEEANGKLLNLKAWLCYLFNTDMRYVAAPSFANRAGGWARKVPDNVPDHHFKSREAVEAYCKSFEERVVPPPHIVNLGAEAVNRWMEENGG